MGSWQADGSAAGMRMPSRRGSFKRVSFERRSFKRGSFKRGSFKRVSFKRGSFKRMVGIGAAGILSVAALSACGAGQRAQTSSERASIEGVDAQSGKLSINNTAILPPGDGSSYAIGDDAALQLVIVNQGRTADQLTSVTASPGIASSAVVAPSSLAPSAEPSSSTTSSGTTSPGTTSPDATSPGATSSGTTSPGVAGPASASATATATATSVPISIPAASSVRVGLPGATASVVLTDLTAPLYTAQDVSLTFTFASGITITTPVPVLNGTGGTAAPTLGTDPGSTE